MEFIMACTLYGGANVLSDMVKIEHYVQMCDETYETVASAGKPLTRSTLAPETLGASKLSVVNSELWSGLPKKLLKSTRTSTLQVLFFQVSP